MKNILKKNNIFYIIVICILLQFMITKSKFGIIIYSIIVFSLATYYFPLKPLFEIVNQKIELKSKLYKLSEYFVIGAIFSLSAINLMVNILFLRYVTMFFLICNIVFFGIESSKKNNAHKAFLHFLMMWFNINT